LLSLANGEAAGAAAASRPALTADRRTNTWHPAAAGRGVAGAGGRLHVAADDAALAAGAAVPLATLTDAQRRLLAATLTPAASRRASRSDGGMLDGDDGLEEVAEAASTSSSSHAPTVATLDVHGTGAPGGGAPSGARSGGSEADGSPLVTGRSDASTTVAPPGLAPPPPPGLTRRPSLDAMVVSRRGSAAAPLQPPAPAPTPAPPPAAAVVPVVPSVLTGKPLFNLDVAIGGGRMGRIVVCEGASVPDIAAEFVTTHGLPATVMPQLQGLVAQTLAAHEATSASAGGGGGDVAGAASAPLPPAPSAPAPARATPLPDTTSDAHLAAAGAGGRRTSSSSTGTALSAAAISRATAPSTAGRRRSGGGDIMSRQFR